jgi:small GTP-binding protein
LDDRHCEGGDPTSATATLERYEHAPLVALIGPPNSGKTTLFNRLTGLRQKVANYPGVTVEKHVGRVQLPGERAIDLVDLPGVHGFSARTLDEKITRDVLEGRMEGLRAPDALVLIVDATRLESQLMLVEPVLELDLPTLLVLNMSDELEQRGGSVVDATLARRLGVQIARTNAREGAGTDEVRDFLAGVARKAVEVRDRVVVNVPTSVPLPMMDAFTARRARVREIVTEAAFVPPGPSSRYALWKSMRRVSRSRISSAASARRPISRVDIRLSTYSFMTLRLLNRNPMGLFISWAKPADKVPNDAIFSVCIIAC